MCYACQMKSFYGTHAEMKVEGEIHMAGVANTGLGRVLIVLLVLALIIMFAFVVLHNNPASPIEWLKNSAIALIASLIIGFSAALRGKSELERPWDMLHIGQEQLDDREPLETILEQEEDLGPRSQDKEV